MAVKIPYPPDWQPPQGYHQVDSDLEGIKVFAPIPEKEDTAAPKTFNCPQCGATTRFDVSAGGVSCEHCEYTRHLQSERAGESAAEFEFTLDTLKKAERGWGMDRRVLHCDNCGADLIVSKVALTSTCLFCASNKVNVCVAPSEHLRPRFLVPFKIKSDTTRERAKEWLGKGWFHPGELSASSILESFSGIYLSFWTFDARISSVWKAEVGHEHQERYYDHNDGEWKTRTKIEWRWESGSVTISISDLIVPGNSHISRLILERLYPFHMSELVVYAPDYLAGWQAQGYDIILPDAWDEGKAIMRDNAKSACHDDISSSHVRNFSMTANFGDESWRYVLLPVYLAAYKFENKVYQLMVNGQTGTVAGQKPVAWWKIWLAITALLLPGTCIGLAGLPLLLASGIGILPLVIGFILFVVGIIISANLYRQGVSSEAA